MQLITNWCGLLSYQEALRLQQSTLLEVKDNNAKAILLGLEHPSVITLGKRGEVEQDLNQTEEQLHQQEIALFRVDRGGQATLHSPGQLVIYPIVKIESLQMGVKQFVESLLETTAQALAKCGFDQAKADYERAGVYIGEAKICFCGLRMIDGISTHGISININNDLSLFRNIRSCGISNPKLVSLLELGTAISTEEFFNLWCSLYMEQIKARTIK